jgi:hypothetical protein
MASNPTNGGNEPKPRAEGKPSAAEGKSSATDPRVLSLVKGKHSFLFRYGPGDENLVLESLADLVKRRDLPFDWFDAAVLSHQLGQHLSKELQAHLPKKEA